MIYIKRSLPSFAALMCGQSAVLASKSGSTQSVKTAWSWSEVVPCILNPKCNVQTRILEVIGKHQTFQHALDKDLSSHLDGLELPRWSLPLRRFAGCSLHMHLLLSATLEVWKKDEKAEEGTRPRIPRVALQVLCGAAWQCVVVNQQLEVLQQSAHCHLH